MTESSNTVSSPTRLATIVALELRRLIAERSRVVCVIDAFGLPDEFFDQLVAESNINWTQVIVLLARERAGVGANAPDSLRRRVIERFVTRVPIVEFYAPRADAPNSQAALRNFRALFETKPADFAVVNKNTWTDSFGLGDDQLKHVPTFFFDSF